MFGGQQMVEADGWSKGDEGVTKVADEDSGMEGFFVPGPKLTLQHERWCNSFAPARSGCLGTTSEWFLNKSKVGKRKEANTRGCLWQQGRRHEEKEGTLPLHSLMRQQDFHTVVYTVTSICWKVRSLGRNNHGMERTARDTDEFRKSKTP